MGQCGSVWVSVGQFGQGGSFSDKISRCMCGSVWVSVHQCRSVWVSMGPFVIKISRCMYVYTCTVHGVHSSGC